MSIFLIFLVSVVSFYFLNILGSKITDYQTLTLSSTNESHPAFNILYRIISPNLFVLFAGLSLIHLNFAQYNEKIWLAVPGQFLIRIFFNFNRLKIFNWPRLLLTATLSTIFAILVTKSILSKQNLYLPDLDSIGNEFWLLVVLYGYSALNSALGDFFDSSTNRTELYILNTFREINSKFGTEIKKHCSTYNHPNFEIFIYSIAVVESFNRPTRIRYLEKLLSYFKSEGTYGILQVKSKNYVNDLKSLELGINILIELHQKISERTKSVPENLTDYWLETRILERTAWFYNRDDSYSSEVMSANRAIIAELSKVPLPSPAILDEERLNAFYTAPN